MKRDFHKRVIITFMVVIMVTCLITSNNTGMTVADSIDIETASANSFQAWSSSLWMRTTQGDFEAGILNDVDTSSSSGDVILAEQTAQTVIAWDDFESGGWNGGSGWLWDWGNSGDASVTPSGGPHGGSYHLMLRRATGYVDRAVDLSSYSNPHLQFWAKADSFESGEYAECSIYDGIAWDVVQTWVDGDDDNIYRFYDIDLSGYNMSNQFYVAFDAEMSNPVDYLYVDDLQILEPQAYYSSGTIASQVLDTGISGAVWNMLFWDETLASNTDITFEVRASDTIFGAGDATPSWNAVGGTSPVMVGLPSGRYKQWRATLTTSDTANTPTLHEVRVYYY